MQIFACKHIDPRQSIRRHEFVHVAAMQILETDYVIIRINMQHSDLQYLVPLVGHHIRL